MNDTNEEYLNEFYGSTMQWFTIIVYILTIFDFCSNMFVIIIILTSKTFRGKASYWFIIAFALSGILHYVGHVLGSIAIRFGSANNRLLCSIAGTVTVTTGTSNYGFPFLLAADRYYKIKIPPYNKFSLGHTLFKDAFVIPLILGWFCFVVLSNMPLIFSNAFGEDTIGICGIRKFSEVRIMIMYLSSAGGLFFVSLLLSYAYYIRLAKWIKENQRATSMEDRKRTLEVMLMMKLIIIIPLVMQTIPIVLSGGQMFIPELPMWIKRVFDMPYYVSNVLDPWLTMYSLQPIRHRALQVLGLARDDVMAISIEAGSDANTVDKRHALSIKP